jgi:diaminopimelate epimerase
MGTARLQSDDFPGAPANGRGEVRAGGRTWAFQHVQVGNPQCAIAVHDEAELEQLDLQAFGPEIERSALFPNRTNVSWFTATKDGRIRARIFERGVGETSASGTGATGAAVAYVLDGGTSPVAVKLDGGELEVEVGEDLQIDLSGWAIPVFRGTLADEFVKELEDLDEIQ